MVELLPGVAHLERLLLIGDPAVARDEVECELADIASLDLTHLARDEVEWKSSTRGLILE